MMTQFFEKIQSLLGMKEIKTKYSVEKHNRILYNTFMVDKIFDFNRDSSYKN